MKNAMEKRETIGKVSTYLRTKGFSSGGQSRSRAGRRNTGLIPNSVKIGAGKHVIRIRSLNQFKKN